MTKAAPKIALTPPQTIPLDKLTMHDGNVRQIKAGVFIEKSRHRHRTARAFAVLERPPDPEWRRRTNRPVRRAGRGRRLRALQLLVKQKKLAKNAPVPCIVRSEGFVEADSLAENTEREALHPLDQFRALSSPILTIFSGIWPNSSKRPPAFSACSTATMTGKGRASRNRTAPKCARSSLSA